jgi:hypothetical protein
VSDKAAGHEDVDPECPTCGGRIHSGCVCPRRLPTDPEREMARDMRLTRAELVAAQREERR